MNRITWLVSLTAVVSSSCKASDQPGAHSSRTVITFAHTTTGGSMRPALTRAIQAFERLHPDIEVQEIAQDDQVYQEMGLITRFVGGRPPDIFFQWGGHLVRKYARLGFAMDLTEVMNAPGREGRWRDWFVPGSWASCSDRGRVFMVPNTLSVTTVLWYDRRLAGELNSTEPRQWNDLLQLCDRVKSSGRTPIILGNKDLWPAGNFAAHLVSRVAGEQAYLNTMSLEPGTRLDSDDFVRAFERLEELAELGFLNRDVNGASDAESLSLFLNGRAFFHPIGDWMVTEATTEQVPHLECLNLPALPDGKGDQNSLLGLTNGYMVYKHTRHRKEVFQFLRYLSTRAVHRDWVRTAGHISPVRSVHTLTNTPRQVQRMLDMYRRAREVVIAPDVGFELEVADAFYDAVSLVAGNRMKPRAALNWADRQVAFVRSSRRIARTPSVAPP